MKKKLTAILIALTITISLLPMPAAAAVSADDKATITSVVEKAIKDHAKKVYQPNADDDAFTDFFVHAFFGNGKDMILNDNSTQTAALFNSCLLQDGLTRAISNAIIAAQNSREPNLTVWGDLSWHNYYYGYNFSARRGLDKQYKDYPTYLKEVGTSLGIYGAGHYPGPVNENDTVQELLSGSLWVKFNLRTVEVKNDSAVYAVELHIYDNFDFAGDYKTIADRGYDTSKDSRLKQLGLLFTLMGIDEFYWEYRKTFTLELPYHCDHQTGNYHWDYDAPTMTLTPDGSGNYLANNVERKVYNATTKDADGNVKQVERTYYGLEDTIALMHNKPWVVEMDWKVAKGLQLSTHTSGSTNDEGLYFYYIYNIWLHYMEMLGLPEGEKNESGGTTVTHHHYMGVNLTDQFQYSSKYTYTYTLENVVNADGSNMIYATVYNRDLDEVVFGPEPMDDYWVKYPEETTHTLISEHSDALVGRDFYINYVGNTAVGMSDKGEMDLRIYENGKDAETKSSFIPKQNNPTCTEQGGTVHTCADCGYEYLTDTVPALGHSYGEYTFDNNASCTADGTQTRKCTVCGVTETIAAPDTARGHSYDAVVTAPTYDAQGYTTYTCTVCGDSYKDDYTDLKQHSYVAVVTEPTCIAQGFTTYTCSECGDSYVDDYTDLAEHTVVIDPEVPPTCVEKGKTEGSHCGVCGLVLKKQAAISVSQKHRMEETLVSMPTYDAPGQVAYVCKDCGKTDYMEIPPLNKPTSTNPFADVLESDWFYEPVLWAVEKGVTGGKTETTFAPNEGCTRAQVVTFLWAANGKPTPMSMENKFTDVSESDWYYNAVLWAVEQGITTGVTATEFGPEQVCTRAQIVTFLYAAQGKPDIKAETSPFTDVANTEWFVKPVLWAAENDVTGGIGDGKFGPNDTCTRAQVVTFLKKVYGNN